MFAELEHKGRRSTWSRAVSVAAHGVVLYALIRAPEPIFVTPSSVAWGHGGTSTTLTYLAQRGTEDREASAANPDQASLSVPKPKPPSKPKLHRATVNSKNKGETAIVADRAGSPFGSLITGPVDGHDVRPALPVVFPDPVIYPWQIPAGVQGKVVVEITIDDKGNVRDMKLLEGLGHGIDEKVMATLWTWRFTPARFDGRAIASQQDVHFRFPS